MSFPGLLIEYLIAGGLALTWIIRLPLPVEVKLTGGNAALLGIMLYAVGMLVDFVAYNVLLQPKRLIRRITARRLGHPYRTVPAGTATRNVKFLLYSKEISHDVEVRSSRDRIARDMTLNALLAAIAWRGTVPLIVG